MNENVGQLSEVIDDGIKISQSINDLGVLTVIAGFFMVIVIIMFGVFIYQFVGYQKQLTIITEQARITVSYFTNRMSKEINLDQARAVVARTYTRLKCLCIIKLYKLCYSNLNDKSAIEEDVNIFVDNMVQEHKNFLQKFIYKDNILLNLSEDNWVSELKHQMIEDAMTKTFDIYKVEDTYSSIFDKCDYIMENKITSLNANL